MEDIVKIVSKKMVCVSYFENEFKGKEYEIYRFLDKDTMNIYSATNIEGNFEVGKEYICDLAFKRSKIVVTSAK